ncbi:DUF3313 domain-containing protein [Acidovorax sp. NCPPB 3576]|uniref:DUF3313 domain-containing protein n=1 Tax=Acidovorax sp. NCPPB 3576 TaxID=2940488 RepID=UPI00234A3E59|nr:DUF3313 domain-containing protein [Acidovorax sp. NCPPB 3576]WCM89883.1 DUF3313 domain-containing protein [Acidovorax sp. NCPPB 3576]
MHAKTFSRPAALLALLCVAALAGCASTQPVAYSGLQSAPQLRPNLEDDTGRIPYRVASHRDWGQYSKAILDPIVIYTGPDHQFEDVPEAHRRKLASDMRSQFTARLASRFQIVTQPSPGTLRLRVTLTGAKLTTRGLSTFTRFDIGGGPYNLVQGIRGKEGTFTGSVSYAVEIFDAVSNQLLDAFVTKQYPNALNIGATFGTLDAAQAGIAKGADELVEQFQ